MIFQDIMDFPNVLDKIIEQKGCVVPECTLRHGYRERRADGKGLCKYKFKNRPQRIDRNTAIHPDCCLDAVHSLLSSHNVFVNFDDITEVTDASDIDEDEIYALEVELQ